MRAMSKPACVMVAILGLLLALAALATGCAPVRRYPTITPIARIESLPTASGQATAVAGALPSPPTGATITPPRTVPAAVAGAGGYPGKEQGVGPYPAAPITRTPRPYPTRSGPTHTPWPTAEPYTPPPTQVFIPTFTPPVLRAFPTPTATPRPAHETAAIEYVAPGNPGERLEVGRTFRVWRPSAREQVWVLHLNDRERVRGYDLIVDDHLRIAYLPDWEDVALRLVSEREGIPLEYLQLSGGGYVHYRRTGRLIWQAKVMETTGAQRFLRISLDLDGNEADRQGLEEAERRQEEEIRRRYPKLLSGIYDRAIALGDAGTDWFTVQAQDARSAEQLARALTARGLEAQAEKDLVHARVTGAVVLELGASELVRHVRPFEGTRLGELRSTVRLDLVETAGRVQLLMETDEAYMCYNFRLRVEQMPAADNLLDLRIAGVSMPVLCQESWGSARAEVDLGALSGQYQIRIASGAFADRYTLSVSPEEIRLIPLEQHFTWAGRDRWLRLPPDTVWFLVSERRVVSGSGSTRPLPEEYARAVDAFFADIEDLGAEVLDLPEGIYANRAFLPPWPSWHGRRGEAVIIPTDQGRIREERNPVVRYYRYTGSMRRVLDVVAAHQGEALTIYPASLAGPEAVQ